MRQLQQKDQSCTVSVKQKKKPHKKYNTEKDVGLFSGPPRVDRTLVRFERASTSCLVLTQMHWPGRRGRGGGGGVFASVTTEVLAFLDFEHFPLSLRVLNSALLEEDSTLAD